ncbi:response regulator [Micavibrio aeruginosavorus]|nr:response regulator [Micavibrio aeruginosavorus]
MQNMDLQPGRSATYTLRDFSVLVVEDYDFMQGLISSMLKAFGVGNITVCANAREAQTMLNMSCVSGGAVRPIDMVLTDWMMPGGSGRDLIRWMRDHKNEHIKFMPVILVSAFTSEETIFAARDMGANEILVKPLSGEKLANRLLGIIDHPRPFVKAPSYFGPDRRRRIKDIRGKCRRVLTAEKMVTHVESIQSAS